MIINIYQRIKVKNLAVVLCVKNVFLSKKIVLVEFNCMLLLPPNRYMAPVEERYTPAEAVLGGV